MFTIQQNSDIIKTKLINARATTGDTKAGFTDYYSAKFDIPALSGIDKNKIIGFIPTGLHDTKWGDYVCISFYIGHVVLGLSNAPNIEIFLEGNVLYKP